MIAKHPRRGKGTVGGRGRPSDAGPVTESLHSRPAGSQFEGRPLSPGPNRHAITRAARSKVLVRRQGASGDCFVATLLAMTEKRLRRGRVDGRDRATVGLGTRNSVTP